MSTFVITMRFTSHTAAVAVGLSLIGASANPLPETRAETRASSFGSTHNDFSCKSSAHPNPVVLLHGLGATFYEDINILGGWLQSKGFCTFSLTYGDYDGFPLVGGLTSIDQSSQEIADFINEVKQKTGADKIDLVGHSEGAFQSLYVTKFRDVSSFIGNVAAIAPPTHGTSFASLYKIAETLGIADGVNQIVNKFGCHACSDLVTGGNAVEKLNDGGPITQQGVKYTIITSKFDELVTPTDTSFIDEPGVSNIYIQDYCPLDPAGHIGEAYDTNVWNLVLNALEEQPGRKFLCFLGFPGK